MTDGYIIVRSAASVDGAIDDRSSERLILSNELDFDRVDAVRSAADAIIVGAQTLRVDNPRLQIRSPQRIAERTAAGRPPHPARVTLTRSGSLVPIAHFFEDTGTERIVYCTAEVLERTNAVLGRCATVVCTGSQSIDPRKIIADLTARGMRNILIEGGSRISALFLAAGLVDELQLSIAPFFVGDPAAPRLVDEGSFPHGKQRRMKLISLNRIGDMAELTYRLTRSPS